MSGQNSGHAVAVCPEIRVANFGRLCWWFWLGSASFGGVVRIFPAMFGLPSPLGRDEMSCGLNATNVAARSRHPRQDARAWDELH